METNPELKLSILEPDDQIPRQEANVGKDRHYHSYSLHEKNYDECLSVLFIIWNLQQLF